jgi:ribosomal protein S18 acetylase RimI-like enzyme
MALTDEDLREAASHRGLKLVKSRKRTPGVGDYGLFGLTKADGTPLFGVSENRLTATAEQIAEFLRKGEASTWAESAKTTPARAAKDERATPPSTEEEPPPSAVRSRPRRQRRTATPPPQRRRDARADAPGKRPVSSARRHAPEAKPERPAPELTIRTARPADAGTLTDLFQAAGFAVVAAAIKRAISAATARKEPILIADRGGVLGCLAWHVLPTIQRGPVARITAILVDDKARRRGVGRALYEAAMAEFGTRKIQEIEAMSDIEVRNANSFYRSLGLKQCSYRFANTVPDAGVSDDG